MKFNKAPIWTRVGNDAYQWLYNNKRMTMRLWNALESTVKSTAASKGYEKNSTKEEYDEYLSTMTSWLALYIQYMHGPCTPKPLLDSGKRVCWDDGKTISMVLLKYTSKFRRDSYYYLFMYEMQVKLGVNLAGDIHPVQFIYRDKLRKSGLTKKFSELRKQGKDPWLELKSQTRALAEEERRDRQEAMSSLQEEWS